MANEEEMIVTPWKVAGKIDYERLIKQFGVEPLTGELLRRLQKFTGPLHLQLRRKIFFSHRDLDWILTLYEQGEKFVLYTGRGPSGPVHIGHIVPWIFTKHLQKVFDAKLYFQMTDDEKFLIHEDFTLQKAVSLTYDNALDVVAMGFDPEKTKIISDVKHIESLYHLALRVGRHITYSTIKAVFGIGDSDNIGLSFFPAVQAAPAFLESVLAGKPVPCLIPAAIDQDPYWRVTRDVAPKIGFYKPAQIHSRFLPGLGRGGKMSASLPETCIFLIDPPEVAGKKVMDAFTGGRPTAEEQRRLGGSPEICPVHQYLFFLFEENDERMQQLWEDCKGGRILCWECKEILAAKVKKFLAEHQRKRSKAEKALKKYFLSETISPFKT